MSDIVPSKMAQIWPTSSQTVSKKKLFANLIHRKLSTNCCILGLLWFFIWNIALGILKIMFYLLAWIFVVFKLSNIQTGIDETLVKPLGKMLQPKRRHQFLVTVSFPHLFESCLKFRKGRGYIKSIFLVKLTVKPALNLLLPNYLVLLSGKIIPNYAANPQKILKLGL